ncbi:MAG: hypothetical protein ACR2KX_08180 [Chitinophagaceae bacterium]
MKLLLSRNIFNVKLFIIPLLAGVLYGCQKTAPLSEPLSSEATLK